MKLSSILLALSFLTKTLHVVSPMCATRPIHVILLDLITQIVCGEKQDLKCSNLASLCSGYLYIAFKVITLSIQCYLKTRLKLLITFSLLNSSHPDMAVMCLFIVRIQLNLRFLQQS